MVQWRFHINVFSLKLHLESVHTCGEINSIAQEQQTLWTKQQNLAQFETDNYSSSETTGHYKPNHMNTGNALRLRYTSLVTAASAGT